MINAAVVENDAVTNLIFIDEENFSAFSANGWELIDTAETGLIIGDARVNGTWYRNGQALPLAEEPEYDELSDALAALGELGVTPDE